MKLVIDTNTLVSGTLWSGLPSRLLEALEKKQATLVLSADLLAEFADVVGQSVCRSCFWIFGATKLWNADAIKAERVIDRVGVCKQSVAGDQGDGLQGLPGCEVCRKLDGGLRNAKCSEPELESAVGKALCGVGNDRGGTDQSERVGCDAAGGLAPGMQERTRRKTVLPKTLMALA